MRNVSNQFEFNSFLKKQCFNKLCPFCSFLVDLLPSRIDEKSHILFQKVPVNLLVVINICNYLIFIAVFYGSHIMVATGLIGPLE